MHLACSSVFCGGGTNQELAHHCLYECRGDIMVSTESITLTDEALIQCLEAASCTVQAPLMYAHQLFALMHENLHFWNGVCLRALHSLEWARI